MSQRPILSPPFSDAYVCIEKHLCVLSSFSRYFRGRDCRLPRFPFTRTQVCSWYYFKKQRSADPFVPAPLCVSAILYAGSRGAPLRTLKVVKFIFSTSSLRAPSPTSPALYSTSLVLPHWVLLFQDAPTSFRDLSSLCFPPAFCGNVPHQYLCTVQSVQVTIS